MSRREHFPLGQARPELSEAPFLLGIIVALAIDAFLFDNTGSSAAGGIQQWL
jgi:hypothetical protein